MPSNAARRSSRCRQRQARKPEETPTLSIDRAVLAFAGTIILISLALSQIHHPAWLRLTAFVGANMLQSAFTGFCPAAMILKRLGMEPGEAFH